MKWSGDEERFLANLPTPLFRNRDAYEVCDKLGIDRWQANAIWHRLRVSGRIVRTTIPISKSSSRRWWTRSWCSVRIGPHNSHIITFLTKCQR